VRLDALVEHVSSSPPRLHGSRVVCIDGRAGAGKTSLAAELAASLEPVGPVTTLHMDDLYEGWSGLPTVADHVMHQLVGPWTAGEPGRLAAWDWHRSARSVPVPVALTPFVLLEGVGSWSRGIEHVVSTLVWVECDEPTRRRRAMLRDGGLLEPRWDSWAADELLVHEREQTRVRADLVVDTGRSRAGTQREVPAP
jgi:uridine kinase